VSSNTVTDRCQTTIAAIEEDEGLPDYDITEHWCHTMCYHKPGLGNDISPKISPSREIDIATFAEMPPISLTLDTYYYWTS